MLVRTEKEILMSISNDTVIDKVAETSALLRRLGCICCWCYSQCILYCELNCKHYSSICLFVEEWDTFQMLYLFISTFVNLSTYPCGIVEYFLLTSQLKWIII